MIVKKVEVVLQDGVKDCGVCSLLSIIRYYGGNVSKEYLMELTSTTKNGVSAYHLIQAAEALGFSSFGAEGEVEDIKRESLPCVAHVIVNRSYQHFLVLYDIDIKNRKVLIMDPATGKKGISLAEFKLMSSRKYIFLKPIRTLPHFTVKKVIFQSFLQKIKQNYGPIFIIFSLSFVLAFFNVLTAYHFKYLIEYAITLQSIENVVSISLFMMILYLLKESSYFLRNITLLKWCNQFDFHLTNKILEQIVSFPYLYYKSRTTGEILAKMKDLGVVKNFVSLLLCVSIPEMFSFLIFIILLYHLSVYLTTYCLFFFLILFLFKLFFRKPFKRRLKAYLQKEERLNSYLIEIISGFDAVKGLHLEAGILKKWRGRYGDFLAKHERFSFLSFLDSLFCHSVQNMMMVLVLLLGSQEVIHGSLSLSSLIVFQSMFSYSITSFYQLLDLFKSYQEVRVSKERVEDLFTIPKESFAMNHYFFDQHLMGTIEMKKLSYSYSSTLLLRDINLKIPYGTRVFLYGASGCGKSTLVKMLLQYVKVPFGFIRINGIDINHYHLETLRTRITYVSQNEHLFTDTVLKNVVMNREIPIDTVEEVLLKMHLLENFEKSALGLYTMLEENGANLSGGERQRLILARSILKESDIYIFDEATSQIDVKTEREIFEYLFSFLAGKTIIVISHRFDNKELFDQVLHLSKGVLL